MSSANTVIDLKLPLIVPVRTVLLTAGILFHLAVASLLAQENPGPVNWNDSANDNYSLDVSIGQGVDVIKGIPEDAVDQNENTGWNLDRHCSSSSPCTVFAEITIVYSTPHDLNQLTGIGFIIGRPDPRRIKISRLEYFDGAWHADEMTQSGSWFNHVFNFSRTPVSRIKWRLTGMILPGILSNIPLQFSEFYAQGFTSPVYLDKGIRMKTPTGIIKVGVQELESTHKLRIRIGTTTYGIPLVAPTDQDASPIRLFDGSVVKAMPQMN